jgi:uncharacterized membrane protein
MFCHGGIFASLRRTKNKTDISGDSSVFSLLGIKSKKELMFERSGGILIFAQTDNHNIKYSFSTTWRFEAPLEWVWNEIQAMERWPEWWKYVKSVELLQSGDKNDIGSIRKIEWSTALPYTIVFTSEVIAIETYKRIEGRASGDLEGRGIWTFESRNGQTWVRYDWMVNTNKKWMNLLAPLARPLFSWNHDQVMKGGYTGLIKKISMLQS